MHLLRLVELKDLIERLPPEHFDMRTFGTPGNPCGCIAHHAVRLFAPERLTTSRLAAELLDLEDTSLFFKVDMTQHQAVEALDALIAQC